MKSGKVAACAASDTPVKPVDTEVHQRAGLLGSSLCRRPRSAEPGMHRFALNVPTPRGFGGPARRPPPPPVDACHPAGTPPPAEATPTRPGQRRAPTGLQPGKYLVNLTVDDKVYTQGVVIKPDPRELPKGADASPEGGEDDE
jgi:hypothetical protein